MASVRDLALTVRVSERDYARLQARAAAAGRTLAEHVRVMLSAALIGADQPPLDALPPRGRPKRKVA